MITAYRIFKSKHWSSWADGEGAFRYGGRWNSRGTRILYASSSLSLAALEVLVNLNSADLLSHYSYATVEFDERMVIAVESFAKLPANWRDSPAPIKVQQIGDRWAASRTSAVLKVPSSVVPSESNYLINILHEDFTAISFGGPLSFIFDKRLR